MPDIKKDIPRVVVLGMGNRLLQDEGVGIHVVQQLSKQDAASAYLEIIDGGTLADIPPVAEGVDKLIIVDAIKGGGKPGTVYRMSMNDIEAKAEAIISPHQLDIFDAWCRFKLLGKQPKATVIVGVEPGAIDWGLELSPQVEAKLPEIIRLITEEIAETLKLLRR